MFSFSYVIIFHPFFIFVCDFILFFFLILNDYNLCVVSFVFWLCFKFLEPVRPLLLASYSVLYTSSICGLDFYIRASFEITSGNKNWKSLHNFSCLVENYRNKNDAPLQLMDAYSTRGQDEGFELKLSKTEDVVPNATRVKVLQKFYVGSLTGWMNL